MKYLLSLVMGFVLGQVAMKHAYDPKNLEENALEFSAFAYYIGCLEGQAKEFCVDKAQKFSKDNKEIFHNKAWRKY